MSDDSQQVLAYHQRTKHQLNAYAKGPASLDWDDQPSPFRRFDGCETLALPQPGAELDCKFAELDAPGLIPVQPLNVSNLGLLLELSFGLSAWKQFGPDRWALRCNPSSGNLHPTEAYLLSTAPEVLAPGVYHYVSHDHHLERRCRFDAAGLPAGLYVGLSSIHWREAWKYGERAFRYCQHDIGHALAALSYAAACLGWHVELLSETGDAEIGTWLGLDRDADFVADERETPDLLCRIDTGDGSEGEFSAAALSQALQSAEWFGSTKRLSGRHFYRWPIIDQVAEHTLKPATLRERLELPAASLPAVSHDQLASRLIRQRRSAQHFNGKSAPLPLADFYRILAALLPAAKPPFTAWNWPAQVHLVLFVHRVDGLEPGLYFLPRSVEALAEIRPACSTDYNWQRIDAPFEWYRLQAGNVRQAAKTLSCHQPIASDSAFSLGMLARFADNVSAEAWRYRRLFWECGLLGQILYLEAEAAGLRGTGIGCFFDDAVHGVLGLKDNDWQSLYHFTVGEPLDDSRLQTFPAYAHLNNSASDKV
ncbi:SagB/ThcOx family dehydrogenase [Methylomonas sp. EFPC3]|uniref:SagB/ThcOx family dehydrogenase n=1 Tax=Methylomonas sp. EFPC3 TaxID=3021710 RepID=UPI0024168DEB|nr:SagB/ThcOx family dehydrogenase [Methylomonas sp. EFPC3]WFP50104.1 SagB/ThcOx family dehydrogenase [Methylomonas sp. EFPC3]